MDVIKWVSGGASQEEIADALDIDPKTLRKHFESEINQAGRRRYDLNLSTSLKARALDWSQPPAIAIFVAKSQLGWREQTPLDPTKETKPEHMTDDEIRRAIAARERERSARPRITAAS